MDGRRAESEPGAVRADDRHYSLVAELLANGEVIPFLGAGANLCDRPDEAPGSSAASHRAAASSRRRSPSSSRYPDPDDLDLLRVSQYVDAILGEGQLYRYLHAVFDADYPPTSLHRLLARAARAAARARSAAAARPDDELRRPRRAGARGGGRAVRRRLVRGEARPAAGSLPAPAPRTESVVPIERPNKYTGLALARAPGDPEAARRDRPRRLRSGDSYVITEDSYIDYLVGRRRRRADPVRRCASGWPTATSSSSATRCATGTCA